MSQNYRSSHSSRRLWMLICPQGTISAAEQLPVRVELRVGGTLIYEGQAELLDKQVHSVQTVKDPLIAWTVKDP
eukprot:NODE_628_length_1901_cov_6.815875_g504_i0.p5 GENE.NODE_628_length_1901_cov_6.815875_g504_i0~~NODE_628_length_1901_cov_6.815875_g504_i0.p5  ORF type:complete len:74 (-),score=1.45 NODE_628_length_1901_cov_6.815875_g504_i0:1136-1357(-)